VRALFDHILHHVINVLARESLQDTEEMQHYQIQFANDLLVAGVAHVLWCAPKIMWCYHRLLPYAVLLFVHG
jgi:hypothetical protein